MSSDRLPGTRLPDDPAYWDELATRSLDAAFGGVGVSGMASMHRTAALDPWWRGLADGALILAASAVLALLGASRMVGERSPGMSLQAHGLTGSHPLTAALAPDDPMLATLLNASAGPPPAAALLELIALREWER